LGCRPLRFYLLGKLHAKAMLSAKQRRGIVELYYL
jgi:hypothetical protein